ncbi:MAG: pyrroline-5-carboxylate reductase [Burkholderiales bacterium]
MNITFLGGGNMATALIGGLLTQVEPRPHITVIDPAAGQRERLAREFGVQTLAAPAAQAQACDLLVLAVKPQQMREALLPLAAQARSALVVSVAAGIRFADLSRWLGGHTRIVRTMPNTPALIGAGITGLWAAPAVGEADRALAEQVVRAVGEAVWVSQEAQLDAVTALSGSGPAYVFYFIEAMQAAGARLGLDPEAAAQLTLATFRGAAALASGATVPVSTLREQVTSKGGTTAAALASMQSHGLAGRIDEAMAAACQRAAELADEFGRDPQA